MIGSLSERITLQTETLTPDSGGGATLSWADSATVFASVVPISGSELVEAGRVTGRVTHRVTIRAGLAVAAGQRLLWQGRFLHIVAVMGVATRDQLQLLLCREGGAT